MVYQSVWNNGDQTSKWVQLGSFHEGDDWQDFEAPLVAAAESQIHVVITRSNQQTGFAAIASISVGHPRAGRGIKEIGTVITDMGILGLLFRWFTAFDSASKMQVILDVF